MIDEIWFFAIMLAEQKFVRPIDRLVGHKAGATCFSSAVRYELSKDAQSYRSGFHPRQ